jgi:hypothetical protein
MPLITTYRILREFLRYGFFGITIYGPLRSGKSVFTIKVLGEVYAIVERNDWKEFINLPFEEWRKYAETIQPDYTAWERWMPFLPEEFLHLVDHVQDIGCQQPMFVWDDAGLWASSYRWADEFGKAVSEYASVLASDFAGAIYTTPDPRWLLKHLRDVPGGHTARVSRTSGDLFDYQRYIRVHQGWLAPDLKKSGVEPIYEDWFKCRLPDDVFKRYNDKRRTYTKIAAQRIRDVLDQVRTKKGEEMEEKVRIDMEASTGIHVTDEGYYEIPVMRQNHRYVPKSG